MDRRKFISATAYATMLLMIDAHNIPGEIKHPRSNKKNGPLIKSLRLQTSAALKELRHFYENKIGLTIIKETAAELTIQAGLTSLAFIKTDTTERPFYHFAFNIPENKIEKAFAWQRAKTPLVRPGEDRIVNFNHWNAHSIFFLDPAGNLVEYIARHDLRNAATGEFSAKDILYASEIGFIVEDVAASGNALMKGLEMGEYRSATPGFWPIGDEYGLLLMINTGRQWASHPGQINKTGIFKTVVHIDGDSKNSWELPGYPYEIFVT